MDPGDLASGSSEPRGIGRLDGGKEMGREVAREARSRRVESAQAITGVVELDTAIEGAGQALIRQPCRVVDEERGGPIEGGDVARSTWGTGDGIDGDAAEGIDTGSTIDIDVEVHRQRPGVAAAGTAAGRSR